MPAALIALNVPCMACVPANVGGCGPSLFSSFLLYASVMRSLGFSANYATCYWQSHLPLMVFYIIQPIKIKNIRNLCQRIFPWFRLCAHFFRRSPRSHRMCSLGDPPLLSGRGDLNRLLCVAVDSAQAAFAAFFVIGVNDMTRFPEVV